MQSVSTARLFPCSQPACSRSNLASTHLLLPERQLLSGRVQLALHLAHLEGGAVRPWPGSGKACRLLQLGCPLLDGSELLLLLCQRGQQVPVLPLQPPFLLEHRRQLRRRIAPGRVDGRLACGLGHAGLQLRSCCANVAHWCALLQLVRGWRSIRLHRRLRVLVLLRRASKGSCTRGCALPTCCWWQRRLVQAVGCWSHAIALLQEGCCGCRVLRWQAWRRAWRRHPGAGGGGLGRRRGGRPIARGGRGEWRRTETRSKGALGTTLKLTRCCCTLATTASIC